mgnify:FL=1
MKSMLKRGFKFLTMESESLHKDEIPLSWEDCDDIEGLFSERAPWLDTSVSPSKFFSFKPGRAIAAGRAMVTFVTGTGEREKL